MLSVTVVELMVIVLQMHSFIVSGLLDLFHPFENCLFRVNIINEIFSETFSGESWVKKKNPPHLFPSKHCAISEFSSPSARISKFRGVYKHGCRERTLLLSKSSVTVSLGRKQ